MLSFECIKNEKSVYFLLTSAKRREAVCCVDNVQLLFVMVIFYKNFEQIVNTSDF